MRTIKTLSIWQPWASLLIKGHKEYETRSWSTKHRGWLAIHAAKSRKGYLYVEPLVRLGVTHFNKLPRGCVLGLVYIDQVRSTRDTISTLQEQQYSDWSIDRFAWRIADRIELDEPVPARGQQRIWNWAIPESVKWIEELLK